MPDDDQVESTAREVLSAGSPTAGGGEELGVVTSSLCHGTPPPPRECNSVVCLNGDGWEYIPLQAGTPCGNGGTCDNHGTCVAPPPSARDLVIPSDAINALVSAYVRGSELWLDASGDSPGLLTDVHEVCVDPPGPEPIRCWEEGTVHHSYVTFSDALKSIYHEETGGTLADLPLPDVHVSCNDLGICVTVNQIHGDLGEVRVSFVQDAFGSHARMRIPMQSPSSTIIIDSGFPDVELTDMVLTISVLLVPASNGPGQGAIAASNVEGFFDFESDLNNFPDWLVTWLFDIDNEIRSRVTGGVAAAFNSASRRNLVSEFMTRAIRSYAHQQDPQFHGFAAVNFITVSSGALVINYIPN